MAFGAAICTLRAHRRYLGPRRPGRDGGKTIVITCFPIAASFLGVMEYLLVLCFNLRAMVSDVGQDVGDLRVSQMIQMLDILGGYPADT